MIPMTTSPATTHSRHPFTTAVAGRAGRPGSNPNTAPDAPHSPPQQGLTLVALVAVEDAVRGCHLALSRPEPGERLYAPATDR